MPPTPVSPWLYFLNTVIFGLLSGGIGNVIAGGANNKTNNTTGTGNTLNFIGGGGGNSVATGNVIATGSNYSSIVGGRNNKVNSAYSSILGGGSNTIAAGYNNTFIAGSNITVGPAAGNGIANALNVNGLWANGLPIWPGPGVGWPGTISYYPNPPGFPVGSCVLMIS